MANVLGAMPKPLHEKAKAGLQDIWQAETKADAIAAFDIFVEAYGVKYERAVKKLTKDKDVLCAFRSIRPPIPATSGHPYRGIRPPLTRCVEAHVFSVS